QRKRPLRRPIRADHIGPRHPTGTAPFPFTGRPSQRHVLIQRRPFQKRAVRDTPGSAVVDDLGELGGGAQPCPTRSTLDDRMLIAEIIVSISNRSSCATCSHNTWASSTLIRVTAPSGSSENSRRTNDSARIAGP